MKAGGPLQRPRCWFAALCCALCSPLTFAEEALVRASLSAEAPVRVGQQMTLAVELLAPGYFASAASFDLPDPAGLLLMPPAGHPVVGSETIDGVRYTVQRHKLSAWPMRAGEQTIPPLTIRFSYKRRPLDDNPVVASVTTPPVALSVEMPPGAERLGTVISARDLRVEETWDPDPGAREVPAGAAFTRTVTFTAPGVPGMVFPPFPAGRIDGLGIYTKQQTLDQTDRGSLTGERRDVITYVCQRPGRYTIPASRFTWFDLDAGALRTVDLPARTLEVVANPAMAVAAPARRLDPALWGRSTWLGLAGMVVLLAVVWLLVRSLRVRRAIIAAAGQLRPVRLQPLNPGRKTGP